MTRITIYKNHDDQCTGFDCEGHADYADSGFDIVCSAITILVFNTINSIEQFSTVDFSGEAEKEAGRVQFRINGELDNEADVLLKAMILGLQGIQKNYGKKFLTVDFKEV